MCAHRSHLLLLVQTFLKYKRTQTMTTNQTEGNNKQPQSEMTYRGLFDLRGKVAVVTGGVGILGQHFCAGLAESGAHVAVVDLQAEKAQETAQVLAERYGVKACGYGCDVSDPISVQAMV